MGATDRQRELLLAGADRYPALTAAAASAAVSPARDTAREFGLTRILDGLGMLIAGRSSPKPARAAPRPASGAPGHSSLSAGPRGSVDASPAPAVTDSNPERRMRSDTAPGGATP